MGQRKRKIFLNFFFSTPYSLLPKYLLKIVFCESFFLLQVQGDGGECAIINLLDICLPLGRFVSRTNANLYLVQSKGTVGNASSLICWTFAYLWVDAHWVQTHSSFLLTKVISSSLLWELVFAASPRGRWGVRHH
jgi:hypothetical protein